jgi:hypothetical protein
MMATGAVRLHPCCLPSADNCCIGRLSWHPPLLLAGQLGSLGGAKPAPRASQAGAPAKAKGGVKFERASGDSDEPPARSRGGARDEGPGPMDGEVGVLHCPAGVGVVWPCVTVLLRAGCNGRLPGSQKSW